MKTTIIVVAITYTIAIFHKKIIFVQSELITGLTFYAKMHSLLYKQNEEEMLSNKWNVFLPPFIFIQPLILILNAAAVTPSSSVSTIHPICIFKILHKDKRVTFMLKGREILSLFLQTWLVGTEHLPYGCHFILSVLFPYFTLRKKQ